MSNSLDRISVALCTYNGERFLGEQLASIARQTRLPDELIVCDDLSTDATERMVRSFAETVRFPVVFVRNERNLGSTRNFEGAMARCTGDLIVLSDQDDAWHANRLERSEEVLRRNPAALLAFSDASIVDASGRPVGETLWQSFGFGPAERAEIRNGRYEVCVRTRFVTGATVMLRRSLRDRLVPAGANWHHDEWMAALCPLFGEMVPIEEELVQYRQHAAQQIGPSASRSGWTRWARSLRPIVDARSAEEEHWRHLRRRMAATDQLCDAAAEMELSPLGMARRAEYEGYRSYLAMRLSLPRARWRRVFRIAGGIAAYRRYGGAGSALKDLFLRVLPA